MKPRTSREIDEHLSKTLYIRLPRTIRNAKEIADLFLGDVKVKMPRQSSRHCHVVFESLEEKIKNLKGVRKLLVEGKRVIAGPLKINAPEEKKKKEKKFRVPKPKPEPKVTKTLYVSNIKPGTKLQEVREAFPGCVSMVMLKSKMGKNRRAILKLGSIQLAGEYLRKEREWPEVRGNRLVVKSDTRKRSKSAKKRSSTGLKIYDGDNVDSGEGVLKKAPKQEENESEASQDSEGEEEDDDDEEGEVEDSNPDEDTEAEEE